MVRRVYIKLNLVDIRTNHDLNNLKNNIKGEDTIIEDYRCYGDESIVTKNFLKSNLMIANNCNEVI